MLTFYNTFVFLLHWQNQLGNVKVLIELLQKFAGSKDSVLGRSSQRAKLPYTPKSAGGHAEETNLQ